MLTVKCYINGVASGSPRSSAFEGLLAMRSSFHLFTDDTAGQTGVAIAPAGTINSLAARQLFPD